MHCEREQGSTNPPRVTVVRISRQLSVAAFCVLLSACSSGKPSFSLPDRRRRGREAGGSTRCLGVGCGYERQAAEPTSPRTGQLQGRLLRKGGATDFIYARCTAGQEGFSFPLKLTGTAVTTPQDGSGHSPSIRRIFPSDIAAALNADDERYKP